MPVKPKTKPAKPAQKKPAADVQSSPPNVYLLTRTKLLEDGVCNDDVGIYMKFWDEMMRMSGLSLLFTFAVLPLVSAMLFALAFAADEYILIPAVGIAFTIGVYGYTSATLRRKMRFYKHQLAGAEKLILNEFVRRTAGEAERIYGPKKPIEKFKASLALYIGIPAIWLYLIVTHL